MECRERYTRSLEHLGWQLRRRSRSLLGATGCDLECDYAGDRGDHEKPDEETALDPTTIHSRLGLALASAGSAAGPPIIRSILSPPP
jgi:hypothetical protein